MASFLVACAASNPKGAPASATAATSEEDQTVASTPPVLAAATPVPAPPTQAARVAPKTTMIEPAARIIGTTPEPVVVSGTGRFFGTTPSEAPAPPAAGDGFQLNFVDVEIASVVSQVLGDGLSLPFLVDPQVKGTMSLQATRALTGDETFAALETALRAQGAAIVNVKGVYNVVPLKDAARRVTSIRGSGGNGYQILIVPLEYVSVQELVPLLQPFAPEGAILRADEARHMLVLAGTSQELASLQDVIKTFDVNWLAGMSFARYPLEYVDPDTLARELEELFLREKSPLAGVIRLVPLARLNSLVVVTPQPKYLPEVQTWIRRLDVSGGGQGRRIYVYDVQFAKADELADSLNQILTGESGNNSRSAFSGESAPASGLASSVTGLGTRAPATPGSSTSLGRSPGSSALESAGLRIVPNSENNSLLIFATPSDFAVVEAALKRLDVMPLQVLIEASLAEVTLTDDLRYGLQWAYQGGDGPATLSESGSGGVESVLPGVLIFVYGANRHSRGTQCHRVSHQCQSVVITEAVGP